MLRFATVARFDKNWIKFLGLFSTFFQGFAFICNFFFFLSYNCTFPCLLWAQFRDYALIYVIAIQSESENKLQSPETSYKYIHFWNITSRENSKNFCNLKRDCVYELCSFHLWDWGNQQRNDSHFPELSNSYSIIWFSPKIQYISLKEPFLCVKMETKSSISKLEKFVLQLFSNNFAWVIKMSAGCSSHRQHSWTKRVNIWRNMTFRSKNSVYPQWWIDTVNTSTARKRCLSIDTYNLIGIQFFF